MVVSPCYRHKMSGVGPMNLQCLPKWQCQLRWLGHLLCMPESIPAGQLCAVDPIKAGKEDPMDSLTHAGGMLWLPTSPTSALI